MGAAGSGALRAQLSALRAACPGLSTGSTRSFSRSFAAELARILRSVFVSEKKPALIMEVVCSRMVDSYRSAMSTGEMEKHVRLLAELVSDWLSIVAVRKDSYLKLNRTMELSLVMDRLTHRQKEEELSQHGLPDSL